MNTHASSSGIVELKKDAGISGTFYAEADLAYNPENSVNHLNLTDDSVTVKMMISIPNVESMVVLDCFNFSHFDCTKYNCVQFGGDKQIDYPTFSADGLRGRSDMYLDYNYWSFAETSDYLYKAQGCQSDADITTLGAKRYGVLGLGTSASSQAQFRSSKNFSIYIESDLSQGRLLFKQDIDTYAQSSEPVLKLDANATWQVTVTKGSIQIGDQSLNILGNLAFDINFDVTALPFEKFSWIVDYFRQSLNMDCDTAYSKPVCNSTQRIQDLPNITLIVNGQNISIPPKIYASVIRDKEGDSSFYLNLKGTSPYGLAYENYVTPSFKYAIIFGASFMSHYYTVFDFSTGNNNLVSLYYVKHPNPVDPGNPYKALLIILAIIGVVIAVGLCCYCAKKKKIVPFTDNSMSAPIAMSDSEYQNPAYQQPQGRV